MIAEEDVLPEFFLNLIILTKRIWSTFKLYKSEINICSLANLAIVLVHMKAGYSFLYFFLVMSAI